VGSLQLDGPAFEARAAEIRGRLGNARGRSVSPDAVAVHVRRLRSRLTGVADILAVRGLGYRLRVTGERQDDEERRVSERDDRPADENSREGAQEQLEASQEEGGGPGAVGALDGAAAAGSIGAVGAAKRDGAIPQEAPDPSIGPD
jgi:hypothetical protein